MPPRKSGKRKADTKPQRTGKRTKRVKELPKKVIRSSKHELGSLSSNFVGPGPAFDWSAWSSPDFPVDIREIRDDLRAAFDNSAQVTCFVAKLGWLYFELLFWMASQREDQRWQLEGIAFTKDFIKLVLTRLSSKYSKELDDLPGIAQEAMDLFRDRATLENLPDLSGWSYLWDDLAETMSTNLFLHLKLCFRQRLKRYVLLRLRQEGPAPRRQLLKLSNKIVSKLIRFQGDTPIAQVHSPFAADSKSHRVFKHMRSLVYAVDNSATQSSLAKWSSADKNDSDVWRKLVPLHSLFSQAFSSVPEELPSGIKKKDVRSHTMSPQGSFVSASPLVTGLVLVQVLNHGSEALQDLSKRLFPNITMVTRSSDAGKDVIDLLIWSLFNMAKVDIKTPDFHTWTDQRLDSIVKHLSKNRTRVDRPEMKRILAHLLSFVKSMYYSGDRHRACANPRRLFHGSFRANGDFVTFLYKRPLRDGDTEADCIEGGGGGGGDGGASFRCFANVSEAEMDAMLSDPQHPAMQPNCRTIFIGIDPGARSMLTAYIASLARPEIKEIIRLDSRHSASLLGYDRSQQKTAQINSSLEVKLQILGQGHEAWEEDYKMDEKVTTLADAAPFFPWLKGGLRTRTIIDDPAVFGRLWLAESAALIDEAIIFTAFNFDALYDAYNHSDHRFHRIFFWRRKQRGMAAVVNLIMDGVARIAERVTAIDEASGVVRSDDASPNAVANHLGRLPSPPQPGFHISNRAGHWYAICSIGTGRSGSKFGHPATPESSLQRALSTRMSVLPVAEHWTTARCPHANCGHSTHPFVKSRYRTVRYQHNHQASPQTTYNNKNKWRDGKMYSVQASKLHVPVVPIDNPQVPQDDESIAIKGNEEAYVKWFHLHHPTAILHSGQRSIQNRDDMAAMNMWQIAVIRWRASNGDLSQHKNDPKWVVRPWHLTGAANGKPCECGDDQCQAHYSAMRESLQAMSEAQ